MNKANLVCLTNLKYSANNEMYISDDCILKAEFCNAEIYTECNVIENINFTQKINLDFDKRDYFKINTNILPWSDLLYLRYFNYRNIDDVCPDEIEIENKHDIVITFNISSPDDIVICFQTIAECGVYKTVMKYNLYKLVQELDCDIWAPLDIRKPFKLVEKEKVIDINNKKTKLNAIGEIKQEYALWYIYHPLQLRYTLRNITAEKAQMSKEKNDFLKIQAKNNLEKICNELKSAFFEDDRDESVFINNFAKFW